MRRNLSENLMVKVWRTGGFIINTNIQHDIQYYNQSGHGTCIFGLSAAVNAIHFEDELWLQDTRYAWPDDMCFFYKLYLAGNKIAMNRSVRFVHLDAGSSLINADKYINNVYASARNGFVFWHRFIYTQWDKKWLSFLCVARRMFFALFFSFLKGLVKGDFASFKTYVKGYRDGLKFVRSSEYKKLRTVK